MLGLPRLHLDEVRDVPDEADVLGLRRSKHRPVPASIVRSARTLDRLLAVLILASLGGLGHAQAHLALPLH